MTKTQAHQSFQSLSQYLGMGPKTYVERGLALKRSLEGTEVWVGGPRGEGGLSPLPLSNRKNQKDNFSHAKNQKEEAQADA